MPSYCVVISCKNSSRLLTLWKKQLCTFHDNPPGIDHCECEPPPFSLFTFPSDHRDPDRRKRWIKLINRTDPSTGEYWHPNANSRVCSCHFVDGYPTPENPDPTLNLGHDVTAAHKQQLPETRSLLIQPPKKLQKDSNSLQISGGHDVTAAHKQQLPMTISLLQPPTKLEKDSNSQQISGGLDVTAAHKRLLPVLLLQPPRKLQKDSYSQQISGGREVTAAHKRLLPKTRSLLIQPPTKIQKCSSGQQTSGGREDTAAHKQQLPETRPLLIQPPKELQKDSNSQQISGDEEISVKVEPLDSAEAIGEICIRSVALDHSYVATVPESPLPTNTSHAVSQAPSEDTDMATVPESLSLLCTNTLHAVSQAPSEHTDMAALPESPLHINTLHTVSQASSEHNNMATVPESQLSRYTLLTIPQASSEHKNVAIVPESQLRTYTLLTVPQASSEKNNVATVPESQLRTYTLLTVPPSSEHNNMATVPENQLRTYTLLTVPQASEQNNVATVPENLLRTYTLLTVSQTSEHNDMQMTNATSDSCPQCQSNALELHRLSLEIQQLKEKTLPLQSIKISKISKGALFVSNDKQIKLNTGLPNKAALNSLFDLLKARAEKMRYWLGHKRQSNGYRRNFKQIPAKSGPKRKLSCKDEFILTLMKLRLGLTNKFLSDLFGISPVMCSHIVNTWITFLARELQCLVFWPDKNQICCFMPEPLRQKYPSLRCIIDCSETFIERPRNLKLQASTWSDYKKHNTLKYLIALTPDGLISFVSNAWGGCATDRYVVQKSGFLDLIEADDLIMADREFTIRDDLLFRNVTLEIPPPSAELQQISRSNVLKTEKIANARIHVERAINRMKWFKILSTVLPLSLIPLFDNILVICAALCNLLDPLVK